MFRAVVAGFAERVVFLSGEGAGRSDMVRMAGLPRDQGRSRQMPCRPPVAPCRCVHALAAINLWPARMLLARANQRRIACTLSRPRTVN